MPGASQVATEASDLESYFCSHLRLMPLGNIDPSLAIGFYCKSSGAPSQLAYLSCSTVKAHLSASWALGDAFM